MCMESQGTNNSQKNLEIKKKKKGQGWRTHTSRFQSLFQSYSNQKSVASA